VEQDVRSGQKRQFGDIAATVMRVVEYEFYRFRAEGRSLLASRQHSTDWRPEEFEERLGPRLSAAAKNLFGIAGVDFHHFTAVSARGGTRTRLPRGT